MDKLSTLPKLYSTWVALVGAALVAAPVDWVNLDWTTLDSKKVIGAIVWFVMFAAARMAAQPSVTVPDAPKDPQ